jgi:hypothetical protein
VSLEVRPELLLVWFVTGIVVNLLSLTILLIAGYAVHGRRA